VASLVLAGWETSGSLQLPQLESPYSFLASTPQGELIATTFNEGPERRNLPVLAIKVAENGSASMRTVCTNEFESYRGYSGVACDHEGNIYLSADMGDPARCWVRKYRPDGTFDLSWGKQGSLQPGRRCLGVEVWDDRLLLLVDWAQVLCFDTKTGVSKGGTSAPSLRNVLVRDIMIDATTLSILGVAAGGLVAWEGGTPQQPQGYEFRQLTPSTVSPMAGEGIALDPLGGVAMMTPAPGNTIVELRRDGSSRVSVVTQAQPTTRLIDTVTSFDGQSLFVSDFTQRTIHLMRRSANMQAGWSTPNPEFALAAPRPLPPGQSKAPAATQPSTVAWYGDYGKSLEYARSQRLPTLVYLRRDSNAACEALESTFLLSPHFTTAALDAQLVCVTVNADEEKLLALRLGFSQPPAILLLTRDGTISSRYESEIVPKELLAGIEKLSPKL